MAIGLSRALFLGACALFVACATARSDYEWARQINTPAAYRDFLRDHPNSEFRPQAEKALARLEAKERPRDERLKKRPEDDKRRWQEAEAADTLQAYESFLTHSRLRSSKFRPQAIAAFRKLVRQRALSLERPVEQVHTLPSPGFSAQDLRKAFPAGRSSYIEEEDDPAGAPGAKAVVGHRFTTLNMAGLTAQVTSTVNPRLVAELYSDPERGLFVEIDRSVGAADGPEERIAFSGAGVIVLRGDGPTRVLELGGMVEAAP